MRAIVATATSHCRIHPESCNDMSLQLQRFPQEIIAGSLPIIAAAIAGFLEHFRIFEGQGLGLSLSKS